MFYSENILSRRGPLGKVWLAAHMERKLSKTQTLQTDIEESVEAILRQEIEVMALRLSGQLLLGVVRIYGRKAKYLLEDCNEAMSKIKMAFSRGVVDMAEEQLVANKNAITIQANAFDFAMMPDDDWLQDFQAPTHAHQHQAHINDITLPPTDTFEPLDDFDNNNFDLGPSDGIGSQDFFDLGVDFGPENGNEKVDDKSETMSVDGSVGVGRDAGLHHDSIGDQFMDVDARGKSRELSEHPFGPDMNLDMPEFGDVDLGDLGIGFDPMPMDVDVAREKSLSRASSPLSEVPPTPPLIIDAPATDQINTTPKQQPVRKPKEKKQIIDVVTELSGPKTKKAQAQNTRDLSSILISPQFLPRSNIVMRLLEIHNDPIAHFLPTKVTSEGTFFCAGPPGLAPELAELFMIPVERLGAGKRRGASPGPDGKANKRQRLDEPVDDEVEIGRRAASVVPGSDIMGRAGSIGPDAMLDFGGGDQSALVDDFQFDAAAVDMNMDHMDRVSEHSKSRMSTPAAHGDVFPEEGDDEHSANAACAISAFDAQTQTQAGTEKDVQAVDTYSKNTVKAISVIRRELQPMEGDEEEKVMSFRKMADKASRRAAASFFFELLVLGTRDCISVTQAAPFDNIEVKAKDKLWEVQHEQASRMGSVAPSELSSLAPSRAPSAAPSVAPSRAPSVARSLASSLGL
ncbi:Rec8 like protein-domain-containing protein [Rhodocollybia butyracea]|uniref:Rec8 like protein-domain-containing protein n=1 Tax=Rhodocollybia butyracea TaxID=206335 RepID=A0A9P5PVH5_9AGAR|nr:Rec8 like protein-domain-containing protein [Rhodocollybia butyracea]